MKSELDIYYREIEKKLKIAPKKERAACLDEHRGNVEAFLFDHPDATLQEIEENFGTPDEIAEGFLRSSSVWETAKQFSIKRNVLRILLAVVTVLLIGATILGAVWILGEYLFLGGV